MVDEIIYRQLVLLKAFYQHGIYHSKIQSPLDNMLAIHHFDMCNEFLIRIIGEYLKIINETKTFTLSDIYKQINKQLKKQKGIKLDFQNQIEEVRKIRNSIQHKAETKTEDSVNRCYTYTFDFLNDTIQRVFDINFENINLIELIHEIKIKNRMKKALKSIENEKYEDALGFIMNSFDEKIDKFKENTNLHSETSLFASTIAFDYFKCIDENENIISPLNIPIINGLHEIKNPNSDLKRLIEAIKICNRNIKKIQEDINETTNTKLKQITNALIKDYIILSLNINILKYSEYKKTIDGMISHEVLEKKDVEDCFDFVLDVILKIESKNEY